MDWFAPHDPVSAWTHGLWMVLAIPAGAWLVWKNRDDFARMIGMAVFAVSLVVCFGASAFYHAAPNGRLQNALHVLDYLGIYLLIAGTVTPIALILLRGWWRRWLLVQIWLLAAAGCALRLMIVEPYWASTTFYIVMGWVGILAYFEFARRLSHRGLTLLWAGGLCYTIGALLEAFHWPDPRPGIFGHHEIFHLWVMAGAALHYCFMLRVLTPQKGPSDAPHDV